MLRSAPWLARWSVRVLDPSSVINGGQRKHTALAAAGLFQRLLYRSSGEDLSDVPLVFRRAPVVVQRVYHILHRRCRRPNIVLGQRLAPQQVFCLGGVDGGDAHCSQSDAYILADVALPRGDYRCYRYGGVVVGSPGQEL